MKVIFKIPLLLLAVILLILGCSKDSDENPIYLAPNGVTIKCDETGVVGDTFKVNGITYTIVGNSYKIMLKDWLTTINFIDITVE